MVVPLDPMQLAQIELPPNTPAPPMVIEVGSQRCRVQVWAKNLRKALATIAEHGTEAVAVILQGQARRRRRDRRTRRLPERVRASLTRESSPRYPKACSRPSALRRHAVRLYRKARRDSSESPGESSKDPRRPRSAEASLAGSGPPFDSRGCTRCAPMSIRK
jgi:hypothetical protein